MTVINMTDAFNSLPAPVRSDIFRTKAFYPAAFLSGINKTAELIFQGQTDEEIRETWDRAKSYLTELSQYASDFFPADDKNIIQVPDAVYEALGLICHNIGTTQPPPETASDGAKQILAQINFLRVDPYPRQTDYACEEARFLFLLISYIQSFSYASHYAEARAPRQHDALFQQNFLNPMRTLNPKDSRLENNIVRNIQRIEFMLDFEDHPYFAEHLNFIRSTQEGSISSHKLLFRLGLPPTELMTKTVIIGNSHLAEHGMVSADRTLALLLSPYAPTKLLRACLPDIEEDFLALSMLLPFINSPEWDYWREEWFGKKAPLFEAWNNWAADPGTSYSPDLPDDVQDKLAAIIAAHDIMDLERISLCLRQNERPIQPILYEETLIDSKVALLRIRKSALMKPTANEDLARLRTDLLSSAFTRLHTLSEIYPVLRKKIEIVEDTSAPQGPVF